MSDVFLDLVWRLNSPSPQVRASAAKSLGEYGNPEAIPHLLKLIDDPDIFVLEAVIEALGNLEAKVACPKIISIFKEVPDYGIKKVAAEALAKIDCPETVEVIQEQIKKESDPKFKKFLNRVLRERKLI